ncbi:MAG: tetratricopeptide repeat protein [Gemmatimonadota bacterium]
MAAAVLSSTGTGAQELPLKLPAGPLPPGPCEIVAQQLESLDPPSSEEVAEADRLAGSANQAAILGDNVQARALLREAVRLDPSLPSLRYRLGRLLADTGIQEESLAEYCAYLALEPNGPDAADVARRLSEFPAFAERQAQIEAESALLAGVAAYDRGDFEGAIRDFTRAILLRPDWEEAHYNRGLAYARSGRLPASEADLVYYLDLSPQASDRAAVEARIRAMRPAEEPAYSPATTLVSGMFVPGMGHFYSGRPVAGSLVLALAAGGLAAGFLVTEVEVRCLGLPVNGECPAGQVESRRETRPLLVPGLAAAAVVTVGGAIHAFLGARRGANAATALLTPEGFRPEWLAGRLEPVVRLGPVSLPGGTAWRASAELRF